jgi:hypothetical protein
MKGFVSALHGEKVMGFLPVKSRKIRGLWVVFLTVEIFPKYPSGIW